MDTKERFLYTVQFLDRLGGLRTASYREDFGYQERSLPRTEGIEPVGILDRVYVVDRFSSDIRNEKGTVLVDVGCHSGIRFTVEFARQRPNIKVVGIEASFSPENFSGDVNFGSRKFRTKVEVLRYLTQLHNGIGNLEFEETYFDSQYPLSTRYDGGQKVLTGFRCPGIVGADLVQQAVRVGINFVLSTPINLPELRNRNGKEIEEKNGRKYGYSFPISEYAKQFQIDPQFLHRLIKAPHRRQKKGGVR